VSLASRGEQFRSRKVHGNAQRTNVEGCSGLFQETCAPPPGACNPRNIKTPGDIIPNPRSRSRKAGAAKWVRDLLRCCRRESQKKPYSISLETAHVPGSSSLRHNEKPQSVTRSRQAAAEQVPHPARPPSAGYAGIRDGVSLGMSCRAKPETANDGKQQASRSTAEGLRTSKHRPWEQIVSTSRTIRHYATPHTNA
jgi:hypothetical protein